MTAPPDLTIYLASVLLERNRWQSPKRPSLRLDEWAASIAAAGFDGLEVWEFHAPPDDPKLLERLRSSCAPPRILSLYCGWDQDDDDLRRARLAEGVKALGCRAVKFNVGNDPQRTESELEAVVKWGQSLSGVELLCECHPGTALEDPAEAARRLASFPEIGVMVHPLNGESRELLDWLEHFGPGVRHAHLQYLPVPGRPESLTDHRDRVRERLELLRTAGFHGTASLEFTGGVNTPGETPERLLAQAKRDLRLVRELWGSL